MTGLQIFLGFTRTGRLMCCSFLQPGGEVRTKQKRAHFLCATYLIRLSMQGITFPLTTTFPFRTNPPLVQQSPFDSVHSSSRIIRNIPILMQVRCLTFSCTAAPFIVRNVVMVEGIECLGFTERSGITGRGFHDMFVVMLCGEAYRGASTFPM